MALSLVATATANATTVTVPAHQAGDLILIWAVRGATATAPTLPAGYTSIQAPTRGGSPALGARLGYKIATGTSDTSGTWTNATAICCHVYRASSGFTVGIGQSNTTNSTTATVAYAALTLADTSGNSWIAAFAGCSNLTQTLNTAPTGMTSESNTTASASQAVGFDTNGTVTSWSNTNVNVGSTGQSLTAMVEIMLLPTTAFTSNVYQHVAGGGNPFSRGNSGNAYKIPLINSSGSGNCFVLAITYDGGATVSSVADNINGTWSAATVTASGGAGNLDSKIYVLPNIASGQTTVTVTFGSSTTVFQYCITELYGIATSSPGAGSTSVALSTSLAAGSFTPTNNNATGGNFIWAYHAKADQVPTKITTTIRAGLPFTLMNADVAWNNANDSMTKGVQAYVQATSAAINPTLNSEAETGDHWNSLAVALKLSSGSGTAPGTGIRINSIHHFATLHFPSTGNYNIQVPSVGNLRVIMSTDPNIRSTTFVTDSEGNTWTSAGTGSGVWYLAGAQPNSNLIIYTTGGGTDITLSWRYVDISGADASSPFDSFVASGQSVNNLSSFTASPAPSPTNSNGLVIANIELGQGPGLAVTAPSGAIWDLCTYTGETDLDLIENADIMAHFHNTASGSETWTFTITNVVSNSTAGSFVAFKAAASGTAYQAIAIAAAIGGMVSIASVGRGSKAVSGTVAGAAARATASRQGGAVSGAVSGSDARAAAARSAVAVSGDISGAAARASATRAAVAVSGAIGGAITRGAAARAARAAAAAITGVVAIGGGHAANIGSAIAGAISGMVARASVARSARAVGGSVGGAASRSGVVRVAQAVTGSIAGSVALAALQRAATPARAIAGAITGLVARAAVLRRGGAVGGAVTGATSAGSVGRIIGPVTATVGAAAAVKVRGVAAARKVRGVSA